MIEGKTYFFAFFASFLARVEARRASMRWSRASASAISRA